MIFNWAVSALVFIFWSLAIVAYSVPNSQEKVNWHVNCQDGVFAWPISISNRKYKSELLLGTVYIYQDSNIVANLLPGSLHILVT